MSTLGLGQLRELLSGVRGLLAEMKPGLATEEIALRARVINALVEGSALPEALAGLEVVALSVDGSVLGTCATRGALIIC